jgi:hypothetical protein
MKSELKAIIHMAGRVSVCITVRLQEFLILINSYEFPPFNTCRVVIKSFEIHFIAGSKWRNLCRNDVLLFLRKEVLTTALRCRCNAIKLGRVQQCVLTL